MGAAAYNRGSRRVSMEADERMPVALSRAAQQAHKDEVALLREQIATLNRDLRRARRCLNSERGETRTKADRWPRRAGFDSRDPHSTQFNKETT